MSTIDFADVVHQSISFCTDNKSERLVLELIENRWFQRLRDISQTANTRLVYMFSEHSRFGHCVGVAHMASNLMSKLAASAPSKIEPYRAAVTAAAILHDIGHLAPGSHTAYKTWYPDKPDSHEQVATRIIREDEELSVILESCEPGLSELVCRILLEDNSLPAWTWEIISGGGWNADRGNWCMVDSILAGVSYGRYNIPALTDSIILTDSDHLALRENRLDAMMHFALPRHAMYRQVYQHRVLLSADTLNKAIVQRARDLGPDAIECDREMRYALDSATPADLKLDTIFKMRESWWRYHLMRWTENGDSILRDLCLRLLNRKLLKTVRIHDGQSDLLEQAEAAVRETGYNPRYYLHLISTQDAHSGDNKQSMQVLRDNGNIEPLGLAEPLFNAMLKESRNQRKAWLVVMPAEAKLKLGRER